MKAKVIKTGEMVDVYHEPQHGQVTNIYKESVLVNGRIWSEDELDFCMKANEAPEKIYIHPTLDNLYGMCERSCDNEIEYTRTDIFIERAADWIARNGAYYIGFEQGQPCIDKSFIDKFKAVMKSSK